MDAEARGPYIPDFDDNSPWRWEWWKFGMAAEDVFTTLADKYNTVPFTIQTDQAFHHDVSEITHEAKDLADFHMRMARRREERLQELRKAWGSIVTDIFLSASVFDDDPIGWNTFQHFTSNRSLDSLVLFFNSLLPRRDPAAAPPLRDRRLSGSAASAKANQNESPLPDTAPASPASRGSPQASPAHLPPPIDAGGNFEDQEQPESDENRQSATGRTLRPPPSPAPPPPLLQPHFRTTKRHSSAPALTRGAGITKRSLDKKKATTARISRRLAGQPPEI